MHGNYREDNMDKLVVEMIKIGGLPAVLFIVFAFYAYKTNERFMEILDRSNTAENKLAEALTKVSENVKRCPHNQGN